VLNAMIELEEHVNNKDVEFIKIVYRGLHVEGALSTVLPDLDFDYDNGYCSQQLFGFIWYSDGTWSCRGEYDGSEWWEHVERPSPENPIW
tara:strand:- start:298 stop:567 length:270 start_codon:yes stop_codon:yes gene_type:complete